MTEQRFEQMIEDAAAKFEIHVEQAADQLERSLTQAYRRRPFRLLCHFISLSAGAGLMAAAQPLAKLGHEKTANVCLITGAAAVALDLSRMILFRRK